MGKFGWAYIGCGNIAHTTAKELVKTDENQIVSVWNRTRSKAEEFAKKFGGRVYDTAEEAINAPGVDGVYIALNGDRHAEYTKLCIKNKKPVLCEKPFTVNAEEAKEVLDYAAREGVYVSEAMWTWHNKTALQVKKWLQSGVIGEIQSVDCAYAFPMLKFSRNPRLTTPSMLGGALLDIGIYAVRYCYELFGMPEKISCKGDMHAVDYGEKIMFHYPGFTVKMHISMIEHVGEFFTIKGTEGSISVPMFHMAKKALLRTDKKQVVKDHALLYGTQFTNVANEIRVGRMSGEKITTKSTLEVMQLLDECRRQMGLVYPMERAMQAGGDVSLEVENIRDFRQTVIDCGGAEYLDTEIAPGMECTPESYQIVGRHGR